MNSNLVLFWDAMHPKIYTLDSLDKSNSIIYLSLLKYKSYNFSLEILEYCDKDEFIYREQQYIDSLEPVYYIVKIAASRKGFKL